MLDILEIQDHHEQHRHHLHGRCAPDGDSPANFDVVMLNPSSMWVEDDHQPGHECVANWSFFDGVDVSPVDESKIGIVRHSSTETMENYDWTDSDESDPPAQSSFAAIDQEKRQNLKVLFRSFRKFFPKSNSNSGSRGVNVGKKIQQWNQKMKCRAKDKCDEMSIASTAASTTFSEDGSCFSRDSICANLGDIGTDEIPTTESTNLKELLQKVTLEFELSSGAAYYLTDDEEVELVILAQQVEAAESFMSTLLHKNDSQCKQDVPLMETRLLNSGLIARKEFAFVVDKVSKEVKDQYTDDGDPAEDDERVTHVKTGVWEVICYESIENGGAPQPPFYVVTGVSMDDRIDTKKLRKAIFGTASGGGGSITRRPLLAMAATEVAEELVGFQSGTMAPICHTTNMALFLEESIVSNVAGSLSNHRLNVGSGMFGKCLSIPLDTFLDIAAANPKGIQLSHLIQTKKKKRRVDV